MLECLVPCWDMVFSPQSFTFWASSFMLTRLKKNKVPIYKTEPPLIIK